MIDFQRGRLRGIGSELGAELCYVVGKQRCLVAGSGDGKIAEAGVEHVSVHAGIGVNEDASGCETLGTVAGDSIAVVEMTMLGGVELDLAIAVEAGGESATWIDRRDDGEVAIGNAQRFVGCGELNPVAHRELAVDLSLDADTGQASGIVGSKFLVCFLNCEQICDWVDRDYRRVGGGFNRDSFAATRVAN